VLFRSHPPRGRHHDIVWDHAHHVEVVAWDDLPAGPQDLALGRGGHGTVYLATHLELDDDVAIKLINADIAGSEVIGVCAESGCQYRESFSFPEIIEAGMRVGHLGRRSVRYEIALFRANADDAAATGQFVHVFVDRATMRPTEIPTKMRDALSALIVAEPG